MKDETTTGFAKLLVQYMDGLDDETLANQIGTTGMTVYNWRTGKTHRPRRDKVIKCAEVLKLTPRQRIEFLTAAGHPPNLQLPQPAVPVVGVPIIEPYQFFGREELLRHIYGAWNKPVPESILIIGPRRCGKTSLLNYLNNITQATYLRPDQPKGWPEDWWPHQFKLAFVDFRDINMQQPETLATNVLQQFQIKVPNNCNIADLSNLIKPQLTEPMVILMDEIEAGLAAPALEADFWWNMRSLGSHRKLSFVVTATSRPVQLARDNNRPSPFFNLFGHNLKLKAFTEAEAKELLANSPKNFSPKEVEKMLKESECWPETLQKLCDTHQRKGIQG